MTIRDYSWLFVDIARPGPVKTFWNQGTFAPQDALPGSLEHANKVRACFTSAVESHTCGLSVYWESFDASTEDQGLMALRSNLRVYLRARSCYSAILIWGRGDWSRILLFLKSRYLALYSVVFLWKSGSRAEILLLFSFVLPNNLLHVENLL